MPSPSSSYRSRARRSLRPKLRQATFILPKTGQRLKGLVNLRIARAAAAAAATRVDRDNVAGAVAASDADDADGDAEAQQLLPHRQASRCSRRRYLLDHIITWCSTRWDQTWQFAYSEQGIAILKCSLAYLLGSMATFVPGIAAWLGHQDGKHVVATITVYFHPARSLGSMYKAMICAVLAFVYAAFISLASMCVTMVFQDKLDMLLLGHGLVLVVFVGGGFGFIGWTKQRLGDPLVNVACSLASLASVTVLTKEGAVQEGDVSFAKISQVLKMILMGVGVSVVVSCLIFPISARRKLRQNLVAATDTLGVMLAMITESFLSGSEDELQTAEFLGAAARHKSSYGQLDKLVKEAKLEHYVAGTEREYRLEKRLVRWIQDITHNMGGLRSAAALQFQLLRQTQKDHASVLSYDGDHDSLGHPSEPPLPSSWSFFEGASFLTPIVERPEEECHHNGEQQLVHHLDGADESAAQQPLSPEDTFQVFIEHLGPSMRSLAFTLIEIFKGIPFGPAPDYKVSVNSRFRTSLTRALELYRRSRQDALTELSRQKEISKARSLESEADLEEVFASCGHFSFSLLEFGEHLRQLLTILDELQLEVDERPGGRSWRWMAFWRTSNPWSNDQYHRHNDPASFDPERGGESDRSVSSQAERQQLESPSELVQPAVKNRIGYRIWKAFGFFRKDDTRFAIKVGTGAALYALPSFLDSTRPVYAHWRGEWGLVSYMLVCSMTIGASNTTGYARFLGTCLGASAAIASWCLTAGNGLALALFGFLMAVWTFHISLVRGQGPMGRFIMLTYNLSVLYAYSLSEHETDEDLDEGGENPIITEIVLHRVVVVLSGCIWGIIITRVIWPISARKRLKDTLSLLWLRLSLVWKRDPLSTMARTGKVMLYMTQREKLEIERCLSHLEALHTAASAEFELKSAFPEAAYSNFIRRTRIMVDAFHAMNLGLMNDLTASDGEISLLRYTAHERMHLSARISHLLCVLASSMKLEYPLSDVLPSIEHARDRLLARISHYRRDKTSSQETLDTDYALLYAYILVTGQLSNEIMEIIGEIGRLFGVLSEDVVKLQ